MRRRCWSAAALRSLLSLAVIWVSLGRAPREASAEEPPGERVEPDAPACPATPDLGSDVEPGLLLELALRCYDVERYDIARAVLEHLDANAPNPTVLFNLGAVHAALGHCQEARQYYQRYLDQTQSESGREETRRQLEILGGCAEPQGSPVSTPLAPRIAAPAIATEPPLASGEPPAKNTPASLAPSPEMNEAGVSRVAAWVMFGGSAAFLLASGGFAYASEREERRSPPGQRGDGIAAAESEGLRYNTLAWACAGGALALASSGLLLLAFEPVEGTQVSVRTGDGRAMSLSFEHQF